MYIKLEHNIAYKITCAPAQTSDHPAHSRSLVRVFAKALWVVKSRGFFVRTAKTLCRWEDAKADFELCAVHEFEGFLC